MSVRLPENAIGHILDISVIIPVVGHDFYNSIIRVILQISLNYHFTYNYY